MHRTGLNQNWGDARGIAKPRQEVHDLITSGVVG
ncbi:Uncharacterised protein [Mycobacteroides abscessus subsp. abscessus]|nr:Uncharacterised protein [Mycobacteroides abscessus subsp. abscessus]